MKKLPGNTLAWQCALPPNTVWEVHRFSFLDALVAARKHLPPGDPAVLRCGQVAWHIIRDLNQVQAGDGIPGSPFAWLTMPAFSDNPEGWQEDHANDWEILPDLMEMSGAQVVTDEGEVRVAIINAPADLVQRAVTEGFVFSKEKLL